MAIYKKYLIFLGFLCLTACHVVTQDEIAGIGLAPDPVFLTSRELTLIPIDFPQGEKQSEYIWLGTELQAAVFNYFQFIKTIPGNVDNTIVSNIEEIADFYGISKTNTKAHKDMIEKTLQENKAHWLKITPENKEEINQKYTIPPELTVNLIQAKGTALEYIDKGHIIIQLSLAKDYTFRFKMYDSIAEKTLASWQMQIPKYLAKGNTHDVSIIPNLIKSRLRASMSSFTKKEYVEVSLPSTLTPDLSVYIDGKLMLSKTAFISQGEHLVYISQLGNIIHSGKINLTRSGVLDLQAALKKQEGYEVTLKTDPPQTPLFINEKYIGLSPINIVLPKGVHYIRATGPGATHLNYILTMDPYKPIKELNLNLEIQDQAYLNRVKDLRHLKMGTFFSGVLSLGAFLYSFERAGIYQDKIFNSVDEELSIKRYKQFVIAETAFGALGGGLLITALIAQILEYQARDVGIGVDQDGNLGINYRF